MKVDPQKGPGRPWRHKPRDGALESPENQIPQDMPLRGLRALPAKPVPRQAAFSSRLLWRHQASPWLQCHTGGEVKHYGTLSTFPSCSRAPLSPWRVWERRGGRVGAESGSQAHRGPGSECRIVGQARVTDNYLN